MHHIVNFRGFLKCAIRCVSPSIHPPLNENNDVPYRAFQGTPEMRNMVRVQLCSSTTNENHDAPYRPFQVT